MNTKVKLCGHELINPIISASGTYGFGREYASFYDVKTLGGVSTKGLTYLPRQGNDGVRVAETASGMLNCVGLQNPGVEYFIKNELPFLRKNSNFIVANVAGNELADYEMIIERLSGEDIDMFELNISCPNVKHGGIAFGVYPDAVEDITRKSKAKAGKVPLMVKLSPNVASIKDNAKACENGGADSISLINTLTGMAVDLGKRRPILGNVTGGLSGPCVKPIALRMVHECYNTVKLPIVGMGGVSSAEDVLEFMLCGASAVMVGTANISDPMASFDIVNDLTNVMTKYKIDDINDIVGKLQLN